MKYAIVVMLMIGMFTAVAAADDFVIGPEDMLQIIVWGNPELGVHIPVRPDGMISVPLAGDVKADGLTPLQLKQKLEQAFSSYIKAPNVSVIVTAVNSFKVFVIGGGIQGSTAGATGGATGGAIVLKRSTTILQLLAQIGALQGADFRNAYIMRAGKKLSIDFRKLVHEGDVSQDIPLKRDDIIFIPPDLENRIKVIGAVKSPGVFPFVKGMTALDAVLGAGGFTEFASQNSVLIVRKQDNEQVTIEVRLKDVISDGDLSKNVYLMPGDLVNVKSGLF